MLLSSEGAALNLLLLKKEIFAAEIFIDNYYPSLFSKKKKMFLANIDQVKNKVLRFFVRI